MDKPTQRYAYRFIFFLAISFLATSPLEATPLTWGDDIIKSPAWAKNSTINVYIQTDPKGEGRDQLLKEGIERWKGPLDDRMIMLEVNIGDPPAGTENVVRYTFDPDGFMAGGRELGPGDLDNGIGLAQSDGIELLGGEAHIRNALGSSTAMDKNRLRNLGEHEFTHVLGLADDDNGSVTKHTQPKAPRARNAQDIKELNALYGTANTGGGGKPMGVITPSEGADSFTYSFLFDPANIVPDPSDPEHIALITMGIDPTLIASFDLPPGWIGIAPVGVVDRNDPFFTEGYMLDGFGDTPPWDPLNPMSFLAFRISVAQAQEDGLAPGTDPGLSLLNSSFDITLHTVPGVYSDQISIWAGGTLQTVTGPVVPEPTSFLLISTGLAGLLWRRRTL